MKTIRNHLKYPVNLRLPVILKMRTKNCRYSIFTRLQKEQKDMKAINCKMKQLNILSYSSRKPLRPAIIQNKSFVYKKSVEY